MLFFEEGGQIMKKLKITLLFALAVLLCAAGSALAATATLGPIEDTYVWLDDDGDGGNNFGSSNYMIVGEWDGDSPYGICRAYLMFDLSSIPAGQTIVSAALHLTVQTLYDPTVQTGAHFLSDDSWDEYTITWDSPPGPFNAVATDTISLAVGDNSWNVTTDISSEYAGDQVYSVVLKLPVEAASTDGAWMHSKEYSVATERPSLVVNYRPADEPDPVVKFQQLPLDGPDYWGHDELSTAYFWVDPMGMPMGYRGCYMADDFADMADTPVINVTWWGSYLENLYEQPVTRFLIVFETDVPAVGQPGDPDYIPSHPGQVIQSEIVHLSSTIPLNPGQYTETLFSQGGPPCNETLYLYDAKLMNPFPQEPDTVYWIKIVALVDPIDPTITMILDQCGIPICELGRFSWYDLIMMCPELQMFPPLTRWGWHNRDYTIMDPYASRPPAVNPGENKQGPLSNGTDVWHFQDDAVTGELWIDMDDTYIFIDQIDWMEQYYVYQLPYCVGPVAVGVDGPEDIEEYSKDLAFVLWTTEELDDLDFGDAPENTLTGAPTLYPTTLANNGARHVADGVNFLGQLEDIEPDGQPTWPADGDDINPAVADDEDGVTFVNGVLTAGVPEPVDVFVSPDPGVGGYLNVWVDFNANLDWNDPGEWVLVDYTVAGGMNNLMITAPAAAVAGPTYARFRYTTYPIQGTGLGYSGQASDGEVEDYKVDIEEEDDDILKFQQLPLNGPYYFGHDELSTAYTMYDDFGQPVAFEGCYMADDFADLESSPVINVIWWGSYLENEIMAPVVRFLIAFEEDIPAVGQPGDVDYVPSHPGQVIQAEIVHLAAAGTAPNPGEYTERYIGPGGPPCYEALYEYDAELMNPFPQEPDKVYWIKIVAMVDIEYWIWENIQMILMMNPGLRLCDFLNMPFAQQQQMGLEIPLTRWGWHNRDYTIMDPFASVPPMVDPGEHMAGMVMYPDGPREVWHFQDDAVSGYLMIQDATEDPLVDQQTWQEEYYVYSLPYCPASGQEGVDGPDEIEMFSKDLAFELWTEDVNCFTRYYAVGTIQHNLWVTLGKPLCWCYDIHQCGDVNGDCFVTIADDIMPMVVSRVGVYNPCADANYDGFVTIADDIMTAVRHRVPATPPHLNDGLDCLLGTCPTAVGFEIDGVCDPVPSPGAILP